MNELRETSAVMKPRKPVILCVDDIAANLELLESILVPRGYAVVCAASGKDALLKIQSQAIDLVLLDIMMPGMDGYEVCRRIKEDENLRDIPVVMVTSLKEREDRIRSIEVGAEEFLSKPFDTTETLARIKMLLKVKELSAERKRAEAALQQSNLQLQKAVEELTAARNNIRTLFGMIPICAHCKQIRNDAGYWQSVERYVEDHTDVMFMHSICPACVEKHFPEGKARPEAHEKNG
ncbi:MAG: response regulator [Candidatus Geothermincolia bacterium]